MKNVLIIMAVLLTGCTTTKYVEVPVVKTDTLYQSKVISDSVYIHDSTFVKVTGDTVFMERWHTRWRERTRTDTLWEAHIDTVGIPVPVEVVKEVERELTGWEKFLMWLEVTGIMLPLIAVAIGVWLWKTI